MAISGNGADRAEQEPQPAAGHESDQSKTIDIPVITTPSPAQNQPLVRPERSPMALASAGMEMGLAIAGMTLAGWGLDNHFGCRPWLMIIGLMIGLIGGTYNVWRASRSFFNDR